MTKLYKIKKFFKFECAHRLFGLETSPCKNLHGHSYEVWVELTSSTLDEYGMVLDFSNLKWFQDWLDKNFDHHLILGPNDPLCSNIDNKITIMDTNTTAENMADLFAEEIQQNIENENIISIRVDVAETRGNIASCIIKLN